LNIGRGEYADTHAEVPKLYIRWTKVQRLFAVFVASVVSKPNIVALIDQQKRQTTLVLCNADPDLAVHHEAVMEVYNLLLHASWPAVYALILLSFAPGESMHSQEEAILCLHYMLLGGVAIELTQLYKVIRVRDGVGNALFLIAGAARIGRGQAVEGIATDAVAEADNGRREEQRDGPDHDLEEQEYKGAAEGEVLVDMESPDEGHGRHCGSRVGVAGGGRSVLGEARW
jgi:hypothetical protein